MSGSAGPINMLRRWHANHRAGGCHLSRRVMGRGGRSRCTWWLHVCPARTDNYLHRHHSADNTQYYANKSLCDSGAAAAVTLLTANQLAHIPSAPSSTAYHPAIPNIWLSNCKFVQSSFHCLSVLFSLSPSAQNVTLHFTFFPNSFSFWSVSQGFFCFLTLHSKTQLNPHVFSCLSYICSADWLLTCCCCLSSSRFCWRTAIREIKPSGETDEMTPVWPFNPWTLRPS